MRHLTVAALLAQVACGSPAITESFEEAAMDTAPVMDPAFQQATASARRDLYLIRAGYVRDEMYAILCDHHDSTNCTVGVNNVYKALNDVDGAAADTGDGEPAGAITVPFFGTSVDYGEKNNERGVAWTTSGDISRLLYVKGDADSSSVYQAELNTQTGAVRLRIAGFWSMDGQGTLALRAEIDGNRATSDFTLRIAFADPTDANKPFLTFRGAGKSKGAGNYFLFAVSSTNTTDGATENGFHCIDAATTTDVAGNRVAEIHASCGGASGASAAAIDSMTELTTADLPSARFDLTL